MSLLLTIALAYAKPAVTLADISDDRKNPTTVWFTEPQRPLEARKADDCEFVEEDWEIPAGMVAEAFVTHPKCGEDHLFLDMRVAIGPHRTTWVRVHPSQVSLEPPKSPKWAGASTGEERFLLVGGHWKHRGVAIDRPGEPTEYRFFPGERLEVLDPEVAVVRTAGGRLVQLPENWAVEQDHFLRDSKPHLREATDRLVAMRGKWEERGLIVDIPSSEEMLANAKAWEGRVFVMEIKRAQLSHARYDREWVDPVGHRHTTACGNYVREMEACGAYQLDYTPFGAWVPGNSANVLVRFDGVVTEDGVKLPKLTVLARGIYEAGLQVSTTVDAK
ncbi:MAG: hypothetical protein EP330_01430 [Deltaproteobacteria bacterium]|nr:MAG: hypothetical protein EP330_01430 [Deltaproteobacteria bacterium]